MKTLTRIILGLLMAASLFPGKMAIAGKEEGKRYAVTITNATRGQVLTPPVLFSHRPGFRLFEVGAPARIELARLAEDGMTADLLTLLGAASAVHDIAAASDPILPGQSVTLEIQVTERFRRLSLAGMLATTNDGFFALNGVKVPKKGHIILGAPVYDAGSEENNESCAYIPGPPCGHAGVRKPEGAEGYVHVHAGIHDIGDLVSADHDWNNPAAYITIRRMKRH